MDLRTLDIVFSATGGVFTVPMLEARGTSERTARGWVTLGLIQRVCGKAFVRRGHLITVVERAIGARLTWPDAIICHITAALLHGLPVQDDGVTHVLVPTIRRPIAGIQPHFWSVRPTEVVRDGLLAVTDRRTTIADCLGRMLNDDAWGLLALMYTRDELTAVDVEAQIEERHHLYGVVRLRQMAAALRRCAVSIPELHLQDFLIEHKITGWAGNCKIWDDGRLVARGDIVFLAGKLVLEYDGKIAHGPRTASRDARRDSTLEGLGYVVIHVSWVWLHDRGWLLRDLIRRLLTEPDPLRRRVMAAAWNTGDPDQLEALLAPDRSAVDASAN